MPVPPLRLRRPDIPILARHFLGQARKGRGGHLSLSSEALDALGRYDWPGNVRELQNAMARAAALAQGDEIRLVDLPEALRAPSGDEPPADGTISSYERRAIVEALKKAGGNRRLAARTLRISEATLYRRIRQMGIKE